MLFSSKLFAVDYLIMSSHKTGTQSLVNTLNNSGLNVVHCHNLHQKGTENHLGLSNKNFTSYLKEYYSQNKKSCRSFQSLESRLKDIFHLFFNIMAPKPLGQEQLKTSQTPF